MYILGMSGIRSNRKNFVLGVINGILFNFAFAITGSETILPVFVSTLTGSGLLIGLAGSMQKALWPMPQIFMAHYLEGRKFTKFVYTYTAYIRTAAMFLMGFVILWKPPFIIPVFFILLFTYFTAGGMSGISFMEIIGKTISKKRLTAFWGLRQAGGGLLAILGGIYVKFILSEVPYPKDYAILFLTAGFVVAIALVSFIIADEPPSENQQRTSQFGVFLKNGFGFLAEDRNFKCLFVYKTLMGIAMGPIPFYSLFAIRHMGANPSDIGFFISVQMAGLILSNILWESIAKKKVKYILIITAFCTILQPILAYAALHLNMMLLLYIVFFLIGFTISGLRVGVLTYMLHIAPEGNRPTYVGLLNTFTAPILFYPMLNGVLIDAFTFLPTFIISGSISVVAIFMIIRAD